MPEQKTGDTDFGLKLRALEAAVGWRHSTLAFQNKMLAALLDTTEAEMSRKKKGTRGVSPSDWSRLTRRFLGDLDLTPSIWELPLDQFQSRMDEAYKRSVAQSDRDGVRHKLFELSKSRLNPEGYSVGFRAIGGSRAGGLAGTAKKNTTPVFWPGEMVRISARAPDNGFMVVLNDATRQDPTREAISSLMPSRFAPSMRVEAGRVSLPTWPDEDGFMIAPPADRYRVYAIWFRKRPNLALDRHKGVDVDPAYIGDLEEPVLDPYQLERHELKELVAQLEQSIPEDARVMIGDYIVDDPTS